VTAIDKNEDKKSLSVFEVAKKYNLKTFGVKN
jgi:hypothetical protein